MRVPPIPIPIPLSLPFLFLAVSSISAQSSTYYSFQPKADYSKCLTVSGNSDANNALLVLATCAASDPTTHSHQMFTPLDTGNQLLRLTTGLSTNCYQKCVDVTGGNTDGVNVTQEDCDPTRLTQTWVRILLNPPAGDLGYAYLYNWGTGKCLSLNSTGKGDAVIWECAPGVQMMWGLGAADPTKGGSTISNALLAVASQPVQCLGVKGGNPRPGTQMEGTLCSDSAFYQHFDVLAQSPAIWQIKGQVGSTFCMTAGASSQSTYQATCQSSQSDTFNQQWLVFSFPHEDINNHYVMELLTGLCLTFDAANNVHTEACVEGNTYQQWVTLPTS